jgi:secondary thiamine-phosphate synthase enzyme
MAFGALTMHSRSETLNFKTSSREELVDITGSIQKMVTQAGVNSGIVCVYSPHTTAGITIQENADPDVQYDIITHLKRLIPAEADFRHREGNSDAHIKASLMGTSQMIIVNDGRLVLGTWQAIYFCEFDGPRSRRVWVKLLAE